jgi:hypothetical protein
VGGLKVSGSSTAVDLDDEDEEAGYSRGWRGGVLESKAVGE